MPAKLTEAFEIYTFGMPSAAAGIAIVDSIMSYAQPYVAELPAAAMAVVRAEPSGALSLSYRRYDCPDGACPRAPPGGGDPEGARSDHRGERCPQTPPHKTPCLCPC